MLLFLVVQLDGQDLAGLLFFAAISDSIALVRWKCNSLHKMAAVPGHFPAGLNAKLNRRRKEIIVVGNCEGAAILISSLGLRAWGYPTCALQWSSVVRWEWVVFQWEEPSFILLN